MRRVLTVAVAGLLLSCLVPSVRAEKKSGGNERLGLRSGYVSTSDGLYSAYGDGWELSLYFTEHLTGPLRLDILLGAIYFGQAHDPSTYDYITLIPGAVPSLRSFYFSAGPLLDFDLSHGFTGYVTTGFGVYSASVQFDINTNLDASQQHLGINGGVGLARRLTSAVSLEAAGTVHYFGIKNGPTDIYWLFTNHAKDPLLVSVTLGVTVDVH